jgi:hypothetical protein
VLSCSIISRVIRSRVSGNAGTVLHLDREADSLNAPGPDLSHDDRDTVRLLMM